MNALDLVRAATEPTPTGGLRFRDVLDALPTKDEHRARTQAAGGRVKLPIAYVPVDKDAPNAFVRIIGRNCHADVDTFLTHLRMVVYNAPVSDPKAQRIGKPAVFNLLDFRSARDILRALSVEFIKRTGTGKKATAAAEPASAKGVMHAFQELAKSTERTKTVKTQGMEIRIIADFSGLPAHPEFAEIQLDCPGGRYIARAYGFNPGDPSFVSIAKRDPSGDGWEPSRYSKQFQHATSAADLLKQLVTHILHVEPRNS